MIGVRAEPEPEPRAQRVLDSGSRTEAAAPWVAVDRWLTGGRRGTQSHLEFQIDRGRFLCRSMFWAIVSTLHLFLWAPSGGLPATAGPGSHCREPVAHVGEAVRLQPQPGAGGHPLPASALMRCPQGNSEHPSRTEQCQHPSGWVPGEGAPVLPESSKFQWPSRFICSIYCNSESTKQNFLTLNHCLYNRFV